MKGIGPTRQTPIYWGSTARHCCRGTFNSGFAFAKGTPVNRTILTPVAVFLFVVAGCKTAEPSKPAARAAAKKWHSSVAGTYKGVVGGNSDAIIITFAHKDGALTATYTIDDPQFDPKPYSGKLMSFNETPGKELTLTCRYEDAMNAGSYEISFSKDLKHLTGTYLIDNEGESDANKVTASKQ